MRHFARSETSTGSSQIRENLLETIAFYCQTVRLDVADCSVVRTIIDVVLPPDGVPEPQHGT